MTFGQGRSHAILDQEGTLSTATTNAFAWRRWGGGRGFCST